MYACVFRRSWCASCLRATRPTDNQPGFEDSTLRLEALVAIPAGEVQEVKIYRSNGIKAQVQQSSELFFVAVVRRPSKGSKCGPKGSYSLCLVTASKSAAHTCTPAARGHPVVGSTRACWLRASPVDGPCARFALSTAAPLGALLSRVRPRTRLGGARSHLNPGGEVKVKKHCSKEQRLFRCQDSCTLHLFSCRECSIPVRSRVFHLSRHARGVSARTKLT